MMQKVTQTRVGVIRSDRIQGGARMLGCLMLAAGIFLIARPVLASTALESMVLPADVEMAEQSMPLERRDNSFRHQRQLNEATKVSPQGLDRQGLRRVLDDNSSVSNSSERKRLTQEERYKLQRELREAARGANEPRPVVSGSVPR